MTLYHLGKLFVGFQTLPLQAGLPVLEEAPRPRLAVVVPPLADGPRPATGFLQQAGRVQALVRGQQGLQRRLAICAEILAMTEQDILLCLDVTPILPRQPALFGLHHLVERIAQVTHDVKLVEQDRRLRCTRRGGLAKRLPPVHHRQPNSLGLLLAQPVIERVHAGLRTILAAKPDRSASNQVAHHDAVGMSLPDRNLVDTDRLRPRRAGAHPLDLQVFLVECLDGAPMQIQLLGDILDRARSAAPTHVPGKPLGVVNRPQVERIVGKKVQALALHLAGAPVQNPSYFEFEIDPRVAAGQSANSPRGAVVPTRVRSAIRLADRFFERRDSVTMRALGSPKMPRTDTCARKPANWYASSRRFCLGKVAIAKSCQFAQPCQTAKTPIQQGTQTIS